MGEMVERNQPYKAVQRTLLAQKRLDHDEAREWAVPLQATYERVLDLHRRDWNGIWFRIVRNFFWSATAGEFDVVIGNPPWVRWSKLPELYRERVKPTCEQYDIFSSTKRHGGNELDISAMISYTVSDKWLKDGGQLAFLVTQTLFQSPSSEGFRRFRIDKTHSLVPKSVDDLKALKPFPDAANKTAIFVAEKSSRARPAYPLEYNVWSASPGETKSISPLLTAAEVLAKVDIDSQEASPVGGSGSPWSVLPKGDFALMQHFVGASTWIQGRKGITADINGLYFVEVISRHQSNGLVQVETRPEAGRTDIGPKQRFWVEPDLLYPLAKGASDFSACHWHPAHELKVFVPNRGITRGEYAAAEAAVAALPRTERYFATYRALLEGRSTYRLQMAPQGAPYYAVYNSGDYTFAPFKVVWAEQKDFCAVVIGVGIGADGQPKVLVPEHKLFFVAFEHEDEAMFLCGLLNTEPVRRYVESHIVKTQRGNVFKHLRLPPYDATDGSHRRLVKLVRSAHHIGDALQRGSVLHQVSTLGATLL